MPARKQSHPLPREGFLQNSLYTEKCKLKNPTTTAKHNWSDETDSSFILL